MMTFASLRRSICSVIALLAATSAAAEEGPASWSISDLKAAYEDVDDGRVFVVAHRGCWAAAPENSVAAIEACVRLGVEAVEIDVQMTGDGALVVFHDTTLKRMTNAYGYVGDKTLAELREYRLYERDGSPAQQFNRPILTNMPIATLEEVFEAARGRLMINLEIKSNHAAGFVKTFGAAVALAKELGVEDHVFWKIPPSVRGRAGPEDRADARYNSVETSGLSYVMPIVWESERGFEKQLEDFDAAGLTAFEIVSVDLDYWPVGRDGRILGADRNRYMMVGVLPRWAGGLSDDVAAADPEAVWGRMINLGADLIMTDRPERLLRYLEETGRR